MEDLRKNYNVNKGNLKFNPYVWWIKNRNVIVSILIIAFTSLLIFYPEIVGSYLGMWFESLVGSFMEKISLTQKEFLGLVISALVITYVYKQFNKNR